MRSVDTYKVRVGLKESLCFEFVRTAALYAQCGHSQSAGGIEGVSVSNWLRLPDSMRSVDTYKVRVGLKESLCFEFV